MIQTRYMKKEDVPQVARIERENFSVPWSENAFLESIQKDYTLYVVAEEEGGILGYCGLYQAYNQGEIVNVAVDGKVRRRGVATKLLEFLFFESVKREIDQWFLEVRMSNKPAITLYQSFGFVESGIRKNFYEKPREDGIIMWKR